MGNISWLDDDKFVVRRKAEVNERIGHVSWAGDGPNFRPEFKLPEEWPRCVGCNLTNDRDIIPALVVDPDGVALCREHTFTSGHGGWGYPHQFLGPPCGKCGETIESDDGGLKDYVLEIGTPSALMVGYLCCSCQRTEYGF